MIFLTEDFKTMTNIDRYKQLEKQISWVEKELTKKEYKAAGLGVVISVGEDGEYISISLGIYSGIEQELLELVLKGLIETRKYVLKDIQGEFNYLKEFIENNQTN